MNGREAQRLTTREAQELLREKAADLRAEVKRKRVERRDRRIGSAILSVLAAMVGCIAGIWIYSQTLQLSAEVAPWRAKPSEPWPSFTWCVGDCTGYVEDGWFNPSYALRMAPEWWQIGKHTYTTRDLMGRRI